MSKKCLLKACAQTLIKRHKINYMIIALKFKIYTAFLTYPLQ